MNAFQITPPMGYCTFYNISVKELEDPEFPFVCERMNTAGECPPFCGHYEIMKGVKHAC